MTCSSRTHPPLNQVVKYVDGEEEEDEEEEGLTTGSARCGVVCAGCYATHCASLCSRNENPPPRTAASVSC